MSTTSEILPYLELALKYGPALVIGVVEALGDNASFDDIKASIEAKAQDPESYFEG